MKIRLISKNGDALPLLQRMQEEGYAVDYWIRLGKDSYKGILPQQDHWNTGMAANDIAVLFDMVGFGPIADSLKQINKPLYGAGSLNDALELNRQFGMKAAQMCGLNVPEFHLFRSFRKGREFVLAQEKNWVFKPLNNQSPAYTYVALSPEDMAYMLQYYETIWAGPIEYILQEKIEGIELSVEGWYLNGELIPGSLNSTIELKRFMSGDIGPNTGCMGSVVRFWKKREPKIYKLTLKKMESFLRRFAYSGPLDCNCIISERTKLPYFLEWTARMGYNAIYAAAEGMNVKWGSFICELAHGEIPYLTPSYDWLAALRISIPPYPNESAEGTGANMPLNINADEHIWLLDVKKCRDQIMTAGVDGVICEVTGKNRDLNELDEQIYGRVARLEIPDKQYRNDVITESRARIERLQRMKYL